jgi:hypothetical protein
LLLAPATVYRKIRMHDENIAENDISL